MIATFLQSGDFAGLRAALTSLRPPEAAEALSGLSRGDLVIAFRVLPRRFASDVFEYFPPALQEALVKTMGQEDVAAVLNHMSPDDRTLLFGELPANVTKQLLSLLTPVERNEAITLLGYEPRTIASFRSTSVKRPCAARRPRSPRSTTASRCTPSSATSSTTWIASRATAPA